MDERLRQRYLRQMGFTPWVATVALPGAAPSPLLTLVDDAPALEGDHDSAANVTAESVRSLLETAAPPAVAMPVAPEPPTRPLAPEVPSLRFTLQAHAGAQVHVWVEQGDADAPGLSREELQLLANLLKLFGGQPQAEPRRLVCGPTAGQPMTAAIARPTFDLFQRRLLGRGVSARLLLCASAATVEALFAAPRYQPLVNDQVTILPISTLAEMLADPAGHKATSWQAMKTHGFA